MCESFTGDSEGHDAQAVWHWPLQKLGRAERQSQAIIILDGDDLAHSLDQRPRESKSASSYTEDCQNCLDVRNAV